MVNKEHGKSFSGEAPRQQILEAFDTSDDFEERLSKIATPDLPGPRKSEKPLEFGPLFLAEPELPQPALAVSPEELAQKAVDPGQAQYRFYLKRLEEKQAEYPEASAEQTIKQSANVILYILEEFQYPVEEEKRGKIIRRMRQILGQPAGSPSGKVREPFRSALLQEKVDAIYRQHMRRYAQYRMEKKKREAATVAIKERLSEEEQRARAERKRAEKEKRLAQVGQTMSEEKLKQLEEEFDAMMLLSASNYGISSTQLMSFGYEDQAEEEMSSPASPVLPSHVQKSGGRGAKSSSSVMPAGKGGRHSSGHSRLPKDAKSSPASPTGAEKKKELLSPEEILRRNRERRLQRGLIDDKK